MANNWTPEEVYEQLIIWVKYHKFGHIQINFKCGVIPNIEVYESKKPLRKAEIEEATNGTNTR